ncbi:MAG: glycosyltransferase [Kineosporiaceae bacterium]|jgi:cellulose synthase (UDP-forming)
MNGGVDLTTVVPGGAVAPVRVGTAAAAARFTPLPGEPPVVEGLPSAPAAAERYLYLGPQRRRYAAVQGVSSLSIALVLAAYFTQHAVLAPFVVPLALGAVYAAVSLRTTTFRRRVRLDAHRDLVASWAPATVPSIDVFLPSCGEPIALLRNTFEHVARLRWPGRLEVLVLDDSARPEVERLARGYGFRYDTRPDRGRMKKAGNLAFGFERSSGDLVLILDADFCPAADMLRELVPYLDDEGVGIVQSPQYFDSRRPVTWLERGAGSVQEIFYRWVQPSRDGVGGAICVGTNALYRRRALDAAGGFAQIGHSEDVHTGVALLKKGFGLRYVPVLLAKGLCPDSIAGFVSQQYRWCAGSMSLLADRGFHDADLPVRLRLCFWTGFLYYIATGVTVFTGPASAAALLWLLPEQITPVHYLPLVVLSWTMFWLWNRVTLARWDLNVIRVQLVYSCAHALAIWHALVGATADWVPTNAAGRGFALSRSVCRIAAGWLGLFTVAVWAGVVRNLVVYGVERFWLSAVLAVVGSVVIVPVVALAWPEAAFGRLVAPSVVRRGIGSAASRARAVLRPVAGRLRAARLRGTPVVDLVTWPEALAAVALLALVVLLAGGAVDAMLPVTSTP